MENSRQAFRSACLPISMENHFMQIIEHQQFDAERALYGSSGLTVRNCRFDGPADGESALKESRNIVAERCFFNLRYPF